MWARRPVVAPLDRLAEVAPGDPSEPAAQDPVRQRVGVHEGRGRLVWRCGRLERRDDSGQVGWLVVGPVDPRSQPRQLGEQVLEGRCVGCAGRRIALRHGRDIVAGLAALSDLVPDEVMEAQGIVHESPQAFRTDVERPGAPGG